MLSSIQSAVLSCFAVPYNACATSTETEGLLCLRPCDARAAKYDLVDTQRTHYGQDDDAHTCIKDHEDALGLPGTRITRAVVPSAGKALRINLTALGPRVLPFSELVSRHEKVSEPLQQKGAPVRRR